MKSLGLPVCVGLVKLIPVMAPDLFALRLSSLVDGKGCVCVCVCVCVYTPLVCSVVQHIASVGNKPPCLYCAPADTCTEQRPRS